MAESNPIHVTDESFEKEVLQSKIPVLVDFWAEWCGPCQAIAPIFAEVATEYEGKVKFAKVDVDANSTTAPKYGVRGIPTLILFKAGSNIANNVGAITKKELKEFIDSNI